MQYDKGKEKKPLETIKTIKSILKSAGIKTSIEEYCNNNLFSCRIFADSSFVAQNGKGTTKEYSLASGYAEFIERIQNEIISDMQPQPVDIIEVAPDEFHEEIASIYKYFDKENNSTDVIKKFQKHFDRDETGKIKCAPFYNIKSSKIDYLPIFHIIRYTGSSGMSAGNSPEEAIVQGIYEIFERYSTQMILRNNYVLPVIPPEEYLKYEKINKIVKEYQKYGYNVQIRDASLGQGFPVICLIITDKRGKYSINFGAQHCLPLAIERALTEMLQGIAFKKNTLDKKTAFYSVESQWQEFSTEQKVLMTMIGKMYVSGRFFTNQKSWDYSEKTFDSCNISNSESLEKCLNLIDKNSYNLYVRDVSTLGFPSYFIFIPELSVSDIRYKRAKEFIKNREIFLETGDKKALNLLDSIDDLGGHKMSFKKDEWELVKKYIKLKADKLTDKDIYDSFSLIFQESLVDRFFENWIKPEVTPQNIHLLQDKLFVETKIKIRQILEKAKENRRINQGKLDSIFNKKEKNL